MTSYATTKSQLLERASGPANLNGVRLLDSPGRGWQPIRPCICVTEPCPCDDLDDIIVWLPVDTEGKRTEKRASSDEVMSYPIEPDEQVLVEVPIPMTITQLKKLKEWAERTEATGGQSNGTTVVYKGKPMSPSKAVVSAFLVGYALGEKIDEGTGLSDKISDFAAEHIPWPW